MFSHMTNHSYDLFRFSTLLPVYFGSAKNMPNVAKYTLA